MSRIPTGSIQRAGENVLALVRELANSPLLLNPGDDKQGKVTQFYTIAASYVCVCMFSVRICVGSQKQTLS